MENNIKSEEALFLLKQNLLSLDDCTDYMASRANQIRNNSNPSIEAQEALFLYQQQLLTLEECQDYMIRRSSIVRSNNEKNKAMSAASNEKASITMR